MAPEIFASKEFTFDPGVDMWALGVILFVLLGGYHPSTRRASPDSSAYRARRRVVRRRRVLAARVEGGEGRHPRLLSGDASRRPSAALLQNLWVQGDAPAKPPPNSDQRLAAFNDARRMRRSAIRAASFVNLSSREARDEARRVGDERAAADAAAERQATEELRAAFDAFDTDGSGCIDSKEMGGADGARRARRRRDQDVAALDLNNSGTITFGSSAPTSRRGGYGSSEALRRV